MKRRSRPWFALSAQALCGVVLWGLLETLALFRSRWTARHGPRA